MKYAQIHASRVRLSRDGSSDKENNSRLDNRSDSEDYCTIGNVTNGFNQNNSSRMSLQSSIQIQRKSMAINPKTFIR
jgi:hypothetical protein